MIPDQGVFLLRGKLAVRVDARTALYLANYSDAPQHGLGLAFVDGMAWFVQGLHWSVRGGRASYWPALKVLYREIRRRGASPQKLRSLAGMCSRSGSSDFAWGTQKFLADQAFRARYALLKQHQRACELVADQLMTHEWPRGWWVHRRDSPSQRIFIAKRSLHGVAVEVTARWQDRFIDLQALAGEPQAGYDPTDSFDRMKLWKRRVLFHRQLFVDSDMESDPAGYDDKVATYREAISQALRDLQQEIVAVQPDLHELEAAVPA